MESTPPTCTESGEATYSCLDCGATKVAPVDPYGHSLTDWAPDGEENHSRTCMSETCDEKESEPHAWNDGQIITPPTTETEGVIRYTCNTCSYERDEVIPKIVESIENTDAGITLDVPAGSNISIPQGTVIDVVEAPAEEVPEQILGEIAVSADGAAKPLAIYDLSLLLDGAQIQPDGTVVVTLPAPDLAAEYDSVVVIYIAPDGSYEECRTTVNEDGSISFETDHFSRYAVIGINRASDEGGLPTGAVIAIVVGVILLLGAGGFAVYWFVIRKKTAPAPTHAPASDNLAPEQPTEE